MKRNVSTWSIHNPVPVIRLFVFLARCVQWMLAKKARLTPPA